MIGVGCRTMRLSNHTTLGRMKGALRVSMTLAAVLMASSGAHAATNDATATITVKATFVSSLCDVEMPNRIFLGSILPRAISYAPFTLQIRCPDAASTAALYGVAVGTTMDTASRLNMTNVNGDAGTPAKLWFTEGGKPGEIPLGPDGLTDNSKQFCKGVGQIQTCVLTPWTFSTADTPKGETTATVTFTVVVP